MASDTTDGSKTVQISSQEVMLKNKSYFKKSTGDEAGSAPKKGVVTSQIQGKVYFNAWSMDVKFEGENVVRNLDITTHNHASPTPNTPPMPTTDGAAPGKSSNDDPCKHKNNKKKRKYIIYEADILDSKGNKTGMKYVGRSQGKQGETAREIADRRKAGHHRSDIGPLKVVCETYSYAAVRGAEEKHQKHYEAQGKSRSKDVKIGNKKLKKTQINPISPKHKRRNDYLECAKQKNGTTCGICGA
jgi:hypothetical protein